MSNKSQLFERVAQALSGKPSEQPMHTSAKIGPVGKNDQKKAHSKAGMAKVRINNVNAFSPNKTYPVHIINKAVAKLA